MFRLILALWLALTGNAWAATPAQDLLLLGGVSPSYVADLTLGYLPAGISFSRAGNAMLTDASGKLTYAPNNLLTYSNDLTNAAWNNAGYTVSPNSVVAPDGTTTASLVTRLASGSQYVQQGVQNIQAGVNTIVAAWAKAGTSGSLAFTGNGSLGTTTFNLNTGVSVTGSGGWVSSGTVNAGGGWWLCYAVANVSSSQIAYFNPTSAGGTGATNSVWHFSVSAVTYETTPRPGDQVVTGAAAYYGPRFDHSPSGAPLGLLVGASATNSALYARDLTQSAWSKTNGTAAKDQAGLDGVSSSASSFTATSANATVLQAITLASAAYNYAVYLKRITGSGEIDVSMDGGSTWTAATSANCSVDGVPTAINTGGYVRCSISATRANPSIGIRLVTSGDAVAVDVAQLEAGTVATSPIITTTAALTRAPEIVALTPATFARAVNPAQGTVFVDTFGITNQTNYYPRILGSSSANALVCIDGVNGPFKAETYNGSVLEPSVVPVWSGPVRVGSRWSSSGRAIVANGGIPATDTSNTSVIPGGIWLGSGVGGTAYFLNGYILRFVVYRQALSLGQLRLKSNYGAPF